jgi:hypothetical protein
MSNVEKAVQVDAAKTLATVEDVKAAIASGNKIVQNPNTWVANLTSAVAAVVAGIAVWHPGFTEPVAVQTALASASVLGGFASQIVHFATRRSAKTAITVAKLTK